MYIRANDFKNNISNTIPADDHSRVVLEEIEGDPDSDYINACYVKVRHIFYGYSDGVVG